MEMLDPELVTINCNPGVKRVSELNEVIQETLELADVYNNPTNADDAFPSYLSPMAFETVGSFTHETPPLTLTLYGQMWTLFRSHTSDWEREGSPST